MVGSVCTSMLDDWTKNVFFSYVLNNFSKQSVWNTILILEIEYRSSIREKKQELTYSPTVISEEKKNGVNRIINS